MFKKTADVTKSSYSSFGGSNNSGGLSGGGLGANSIQSQLRVSCVEEPWLNPALLGYDLEHDNNNR